MDKIKCKACPNYQPIATEGHGICASPESFFPTKAEDTCHFLDGINDELTCGDCDRLGNDTLCFSCKATDGAIHGDHLCAGFIDKKEQQILKIWYDWFLTDQLSKERILELYKQTKKWEKPWEA